MLTSDGQTRAPVIVPRGTPEREIPPTIGDVTQCGGSYLVIGKKGEKTLIHPNSAGKLAIGSLDTSAATLNAQQKYLARI